MESSHVSLWKMMLALVVGLSLTLPFPVHAQSSTPSTHADRLFSNVKQIESGSHSGYAIKEDGSAWAWGGGYGSLGNGSTNPAFTPVKMHIDQVKQISSGYRHTLVLKQDGTVWAVGGNEHGQLGNGEQSSAIEVEPMQVQGLSDIKQISAGDHHSLALMRDGTVWAWGGNEYGQLGNDPGKNVLEPVQVPGLSSIVTIEAGRYTSLAIDNGGTIFEWGLKKLKGLALEEYRKPTPLPGAAEYAAVATIYDEASGLQFNGTVMTWSNFSSDPTEVALAPILVPGLSDIVAISARSAVKSDGTVWTWMRDVQGTFKVTQIIGIENAVSIKDEGSTRYVLLKDGHVMSWGWNAFGQTGLGVPSSASSYVVQNPALMLNSVSVTLNGKVIELAVPPLIVNGVTYAPLRGIFEQMGVTVRWDVPSRSVIATNGETKIELNTITGQTTVNGIAISSDQKPFSNSGSILVPLRLISETMGADVKWDPDAYSVHIIQS